MKYDAKDVTVSLEEKLKLESVTGVSNKADANIAGITPTNVDPLCDAIAKVL